MYQESTLHLSEKLEKERARANSAEDELKRDRIRNKNKEISDEACDIEHKATIRLVRRILMGLCIITVAVGILLYVYKKFFSEDGSKDTIFYLLSALAYILPALGLLPKAMSDYKISLDEAKKLEGTKIKT
jgi:hypothetical protein